MPIRGDETLEPGKIHPNQPNAPGQATNRYVPKDLFVRKNAPVAASGELYDARTKRFIEAKRKKKNPLAEDQLDSIPKVNPEIESEEQDLKNARPQSRENTQISRDISKTWDPIHGGRQDDETKDAAEALAIDG
tara:strand:- start:5966 stop:6367 length:402 start_codon:yes stop_codon:yes gene_type:complete